MKWAETKRFRSNPGWSFNFSYSARMACGSPRGVQSTKCLGSGNNFCDCTVLYRSPKLSTKKNSGADISLVYTICKPSVSPGRNRPICGYFCRMARISMRTIITIPKPRLFSFEECLWFLDRNYDDCMHHVDGNAVSKVISINHTPVAFTLGADKKNLLIEIVDGKVNDDV